MINKLHRMFLRLLQLPRALLSLDVFWYWPRTRPKGHFLRGIPAILVAVVLVTFSFYAHSVEEPVDSNALMRQAVDAHAAGNHGLANLLIDKAGELDVGNGATRLQNAQMLIAAGRVQQGLAIIKDLTPLDDTGYPPARQMVIMGLQKQLLQTTEQATVSSPQDTIPATEDSNATDAPQERDLEKSSLSSAPLTSQELNAKSLLILRNIEKQCERLLQEDPDNRLAQDQLAGIYFRQGRFEEATKVLSPLADASEEFRSFYAQSLVQAGRPMEAKSHAALAAAYHRERLDSLERDDKPDEESRRYHLDRLCVSLAISGEFRQAAKRLTAELDKGGSDDDSHQRLLVEVLLTWADSLPVKDSRTGKINETMLAHRMTLLDSAIQYGSNDPRVLQRIGAIAGVEGQTAKQARESLRKLAGQTESTPTLQFLLGVSAMKEGDAKEATKLFQQVDKNAPGSPAVMNNIAFTMASSGEGELDEALDLINRAIEIDPGNAELFDTRGFIHIKLNDWESAVKDLDLAVDKGVRDMKTAYQNLLLAHEALGNEEEAERVKAKLAGL